MTDNTKQKELPGLSRVTCGKCGNETVSRLNFTGENAERHRCSTCTDGGPVA